MCLPIKCLEEFPGVDNVLYIDTDSLYLRSENTDIIKFAMEELGVKLEVDKRWGTEITLMVTYLSILRPSERKEQTIFYAEGQGVLMTTGGSETATWTGQGIAHVSGNKRTDRGSVFCSASSKGKLIFLNNIVGVFEYEANLEDGTAEGKVWERK
jgi:hypothetical protein